MCMTRDSTREPASSLVRLRAALGGDHKGGGPRSPGCPGKAKTLRGRSDVDMRLVPVLLEKKQEVPAVQQCEWFVADELVCVRTEVRRGHQDSLASALV